MISQAAVTRLASLKRGPINADSLGENLVFRKSADVKKVPNGSFQRLDLGEVTFLDFPFRMKESRKCRLFFVADAVDAFQKQTTT